jgi:hypothetical protein
MAEEPQQVTTFCPRCGSPIVWSVTPVEGGEQMEVTGYACYCQLSEDEWADLGLAAADALDDRGDAGERDARCVAEDPPP